MVQDQGIEVYLALFGDITRRYKEYPVPATSPGFTGNPNEVYIEAVDGERFVIVADTWKLSDVKEGRYIHHAFRRQIKEGTVTCGTIFVPLQIGGEELTKDEVERSVADYGKIVVKMWRSSLKRSGSLFTTKAHIPDTEVSSKIVVEDSHSCRCRLTDGSHEYTFESIEGRHEVPITFMIRCRSRDALRKLKIITNDTPCIDLTADPDTPPRVTHETDDDSSDSEVIRRRVWTREDFIVSRSRYGRRRVGTASYKPLHDAEIYDMEDAWKEVEVRGAPTASGSTTASQPLELDGRSATSASQISQSSSAAAPIPATDTSNAALSSSTDRIKKRRALEDALEDIEFEQQKRRMQRELARLEEDAE